jgi:AraC-like DNA-binding protein
MAGSADEWQDVVSNCFVPLTCLAFESAFSGTMRYTRLDDRTSVSTVTTAGTSAERTERTARNATCDDLHLSLQVSSSGIVSQDGRRAAVNAGDITTYATDRAYHLDYSRPDQQQLIIQVSRSSLGLPNEMIEASCHRLRMPRVRAAQVLFDFVAGLQRDGVADVAVSADAQTTRDLAAAMIRSSYATAPAMPRTDRALLLTIEDYMRRNASRTSLTLDEVAASHGVSRRKLFLLFEADHLTPADYLRRYRLQQAAAMLAQPRATRPTISAVAYANGFDDPDVFTRAFRREFDCTPRDYRARTDSDRRARPASRFPAAS